MMGKALPLRSDLSADALRAQARQEKKGRVVARMLAIAHALDGVGRAQAARLAGLDRQALRDTVIRYNAEGVAGFHDRRSPGRPPWLSLDERATLKEVILARPDLERDGCVEWTLPVLCEEVIAGRFGKTLHPACRASCGAWDYRARKRVPNTPKAMRRLRKPSKKAGFPPS
jgi:transposase